MPPTHSETGPVQTRRELHPFSAARIAWDGVTPLIMGILNVTPDSFSDGGNDTDVDAAVARGCAMVDAGARIIDIGGESTRPGAVPVPADAEAARVLPVIAKLAQLGLPAALSVDTYKADVAKAALAAGAHLVNDVSTLRDPEMIAVVARACAGLIISHAPAAPHEVHEAHEAQPRDDVVAEVCTALADAAARAQAGGIDAARVLVDPGLGFGKSVADNLALTRALGRLRALGYPVVFGASRKRFLGTITGHSEPRARDGATAVLSALAAQSGGAQVFRVHDVRGTRDALALVAALQGVD